MKDMKWEMKENKVDRGLLVAGCWSQVAGRWALVPQRGRLRPRQQLSATDDTVNLEGLHAFQARRPVPFRYCSANPCPSRCHWPSRYIHQT